MFHERWGVLFFKQDCSAFSYFTQNSNSDIGAFYKMHMCHVLCVCGAGVGIHWFSKILLEYFILWI